MKQPILVPYNAAGQAAFETFTEIAERLWNTAKRATAEYIRAAMPDAETVSERYEKGRYYRTVETPGQTQETIIYDYRAREVLITEKEGRKCRSNSDCYPRPHSVCVAGASYATSQA
jgi:hypothetical protein